MEIIKIIGIGLTALAILIILRQYKPEFALYVSLIAGIIILTMILTKVTGVIHLIKDISNRAGINSQLIGLLLKITGIAFLTEFATSVSNDCGESAIANKIELGGKMIIIVISLPIISSLLESILKVIA